MPFQNCSRRIDLLNPLFLECMPLLRSHKRKGQIKNAKIICGQSFKWSFELMSYELQITATLV